MRKIREKYEISFGFQYGAWQLDIRLPDWEEYGSEMEARKKNEETMVFALLTADAIFLFQDGSVQKISPMQRELYRFSSLNEDAYNRLGPPLSPDDIDRLIERDELETVIFGDRYMMTENDYTEFAEDLRAAYQEMKRQAQPSYRMPKTEEYPECEGMHGYLFESIWYKVEHME